MTVEIHYCHGTYIYIDDELIEDAYGTRVIGENKIRLFVYKGHIDITAEEMTIVFDEKPGMKSGKVTISINDALPFLRYKTP